MPSPGDVIGSISETANTGEFEWRINNCDEQIFEIETGSRLNSPEFSFSSCTWFIRIYPNGVYSSCAEWISLYLRLEESDTRKIVSYSFAMSLDGIELISRKSFDVLFEDDGEGWEEFIEKKKILDHQSKNTKSCSELIIKIRLKEPVFHDDEDALLKVRTKGREILHQNYRDLLFHSEDRDLLLKVKDKEFRVHRYIMQFRCPVFKSMLSHEMLEKNSGVVEIPDCDPLAFEQFLLYIYTGELEVLDESTMLGLYFIADKYDMENLKEECSAFIKKSISAQVVCDVIKLALNHSDSVLLELATKYFVDNSKEIFVTVGWQTYMKENPTQANELIIKAFDKCSQCCIRSQARTQGEVFGDQNPPEILE